MAVSGGGAKAAAVLLLAALLTGCGHTDRVAGPSRVDVGFCQDMAVHHEQAVLMSELALEHGTAAIRGLAMSILQAQAEEVGAMRGWLRVWHESAVSRHPMAWMPHHTSSSMPGMPGMSSPTAMPGMASPDQLLELTRRSGKRFDILFLQLMIRHHAAGVDMAHTALGLHPSALVAGAARQMIAGQVEEIGEMRALLSTDGARPLNG